jgi:hypothetical protein
LPAGRSSKSTIVARFEKVVGSIGLADANGINPATATTWTSLKIGFNGTFS